MPAALTCPYDSLSPDLQNRTLIYHTIHGIARYITSPDTIGNNPHPLDLAFLLGLSSKVAWYPKDHSKLEKLPHHWSTTISRLLYEYAGRPIWGVDPIMLEVRLQRLVATLQETERFDAVFKKLLADCTEHFYFSSHPGDNFMKEQIMKEHDFSRVPQDVYQKLDSSLAALEAALLEKDPMMKQHLRESHSLLVTYPETVVLLKPGEVNTLIRAAEQHTNTQIVKAIATSKGSGSRKKASLDDI